MLAAASVDSLESTLVLGGIQVCGNWPATIGTAYLYIFIIFTHVRFLRVSSAALAYRVRLQLCSVPQARAESAGRIKRRPLFQTNGTFSIGGARRS